MGKELGKKTRRKGLRSEVKKEKWPPKQLSIIVLSLGLKVVRSYMTVAMCGLVSMSQSMRWCPGLFHRATNHGMRLILHKDWPMSETCLGRQVDYQGERMVEFTYFYLKNCF